MGRAGQGGVERAEPSWSGLAAVRFASSRSRLGMLAHSLACRTTVVGLSGMMAVRVCAWVHVCVSG